MPFSPMTIFHSRICKAKNLKQNINPNYYRQNQDLNGANHPK